MLQFSSTTLPTRSPYLTVFIMTSLITD